jgi:hypothetical protein
VRLRPEALRRYRTADEAFMRRSPGEGASSWRERLDEQVRRRTCRATASSCPTCRKIRNAMEGEDAVLRGRL